MLFISLNWVSLCRKKKIKNAFEYKDNFEHSKLIKDTILATKSILHHRDFKQQLVTKI